MDSVGEELERLVALRRAGSIDDAEYDILKARILEDALPMDSDTDLVAEKTSVLAEKEVDDHLEKPSIDPETTVESDSSEPVQDPDPSEGHRDNNPSLDRTASFCKQCGTPASETSRFCGTCGALLHESAQSVQEPDVQAEPLQTPTIATPTSQFCRTCGKPVAATAAICLNCGTGQPPSGPATARAVGNTPEPKSFGIAILLTILWPGAGHLYIGNSQKGTPFIVANAIGFILAFAIILLPLAVIIWLVTLLMTAPNLSKEVTEYNSSLTQ